MTPDDALIEAMRASVREQALDPFLSEALTPNALDWIAFLAGHAAYAAMVEHLGLTWEMERCPQGVDHDHPRRLVSKWVEVTQP